MINKENFFTRVIQNDIEQVKDYITNGANINMQDQEEKTGLHHSAKNNYNELTEYFC